MVESNKDAIGAVKTKTLVEDLENDKHFESNMDSRVIEIETKSIPYVEHGLEENAHKEKYHCEDRHVHKMVDVSSTITVDAQVKQVNLEFAKEHFGRITRNFIFSQMIYLSVKA